MQLKIQAIQLIFCSNGVKIRTSNNGWNKSGDTFIYWAFGQSLVGTNDIPVTGLYRMYFGATSFSAAPFLMYKFNPNAFVNVLGSTLNESTGTVGLVGEANIAVNGT